jgi:hypothetical protein
MKKLWQDFWDLFPFISLVLLIIAYTVSMMNQQYFYATVFLISAANIVLLLTERR